MYHCFECQRRTGAVISNQARFRREQLRGVTLRRGRGDPKSGNALTFHFWPVCGSAVYWEAEGFPGYAAVGKPGLVSPSCKNRQKSREGCSLDHALRWAVATREERPRIGRKFRHTDRYAVLRQERGRFAMPRKSISWTRFEGHQRVCRSGGSRPAHSNVSANCCSLRAAARSR